MNTKTHLIAIYLFLLPIFIFSQEMVLYNETNSPLTLNKLTALAIDSSNAVWVGSDTTLLRLQNKVWTTSLTSSTSFRDIEISPNGTAYTITNFPNIIWENLIRGWHSIASFNDLDCSPENIAIKNDTTIYFPLINQWPNQLEMNEIAIYNGVDSLTILAPEVIRDGNLSMIYGINSIAPLGVNSLLITDWEGFHIFNGVDWQLNNPDGHVEGENYFTTKVKNHVFVIGENFFEYQNNLYLSYPEIDSVLLSDSLIATCIAIENSNIFWIGTSSGKLIKYSGSVQTFELTNSSITDISVDLDGNKWFISNKGLFLFNEDKIVNVEKETEPISIFELSQNYPNPFNPSTTIKYSIPFLDERYTSQQNITLKVYDILGREVATLVNVSHNAGNYEVKFDAKNLTSGIYYYRLQSGNFSESRKMLLLK